MVGMLKIRFKCWARPLATLKSSTVSLRSTSYVPLEPIQEQIEYAEKAEHIVQKKPVWRRLVQLNSISSGRRRPGASLLLQSKLPEPRDLSWKICESLRSSLCTRTILLLENLAKTNKKGADGAPTMENSHTTSVSTLADSGDTEKERVRGCRPPSQARSHTSQRQIMLIGILCGTKIMKKRFVKMMAMMKLMIQRAWTARTHSITHSSGMEVRKSQQKSSMDQTRVQLLPPSFIFYFGSAHRQFKLHHSGATKSVWEKVAHSN